ncbi:MAG: hypothetical protein Q7R79_00860 [bacterium]|nr:hypothetical protein [bacterium]
MKRMTFRIAFFLSIVSALTIFFFLYSLLPRASKSTTTVRLNSPDETANYFFSVTFSETGELRYTEPLLTQSKGYVHPRSMTASPRGEDVVPVAFLGMSLIHGAIAKVVGTGAILFVTPFIAVLTSIFFTLLLVRIFPKPVAYGAAILFLVHPAYWYNANRSMLPNVLFVDFLIIGISLALVGLQKEDIQSRWRRIIQYVATSMGACSLGIALMIRLSEGLWIFAVLLFLGIVLWRRIAWKRVPLFCIMGALPIAFLLYWNWKTYGHALFFGYQTGDILPAVQAFDNTVDVVRTFDTQRLHEVRENIGSVGSFLLRYAMPFGFHPSLAILHFKEYILNLFWWMTIPATLGCLLSLRSGVIECIKKRFSPMMIYTVVFLCITIWLVPYYGSWKFTDNISGIATIGNSYVRYWLIIYCLSTPFIALVLYRLYTYAHGSMRAVGYAGVITLFIFYSFQSVLWQSEESVFAVSQNIASYEIIVQKVMERTPEDSVIVSARSDKLFFPYRKVAQHVDEFREIELVAPLAEKVPLYYYGLWDKKGAEFVSKKYFEPYKRKLEFVSDITEKERLYKVLPL